MRSFLNLLTNQLSKRTDMSTTRFHVVTDETMPAPEAIPAGAVLVPQSVYGVGRGAAGFTSPPPIRFGSQGAPGIHLHLALRGDYRELPDAESVVPGTNVGQKIGFRMNWPGYANWFKHFTIPAAAGLCKKGPLAREVARQVQDFLQTMSGNIPAPDARNWNVANIRLEDLVLLELRQVSQGSWQAVLCLIVVR
ncbi:hypothetical protein PsYK624_043580 [Phanerochaete sordida]|uniref:Uncharacterized protein n=1 Tax=Phanerochaete sordida TaxID=48140 RepID=A0A9P3G667_9APHY|nr:hypothetical protein PsYK624_043580 [Phanerochaete sordida]